ncbi:MAG: WD40 repeat domain-containing protein [Gemmataceae bacterium]
MMLKFESTLFDPSGGEIVERIEEAIAAANKRCRTRLLTFDPAKARKLAREVQSPQGVTSLRGGRGAVPASLLRIAWWTDPTGRKHVVLRSYRAEDDRCRMILTMSFPATLALVWVYPGCGIFHAADLAGTSRSLLVCCPCGAVGTPESIAWMGRSCGPCDDYYQEFGRFGWTQPHLAQPWVQRAPLDQIIFRADGQLLVGIEKGYTVTLWPTNGTEPKRIRLGQTEETTGVAITADGQFLLLGQRAYEEGVVLSEQVRVLRLSDEQLEAEPITRGDCFGAVSVGPTDEVIVSTADGFAWLRVGTRELIRGIPFGNSWESLPYLSADGTHVAAIRPDAVTIWNAISGQQEWNIPTPAMELAPLAFNRYCTIAFHAGRQLLAIPTQRGCQLIRFQGGPGQRFLPVPGGHVFGMRFSPCGQWLMLRDAKSGVNMIQIQETDGSLKPLFRGRIDGVSTPIDHFTISPDGQTLAITGWGGIVQLLPLARFRTVAE